jgi:predicted TIM-barrel fold metal-dependent hydrolase
MTMTADTPILDAHMHQWDLRSNPSEAAILVKLFGWNDSVKEWVAKLLFPKSTLRFVGKIDYVSNDYLIEDYRAELGQLASRFLGTVYVEAIWKAKKHIDLARQTAWVERLDPGASIYKAIVASAELERRDLGELLQAHEGASTRFRGIRDKLAIHPNRQVMDYARSPTLMQDRAWRAGYQMLAERGLSFDAWMYYHQLPDFIDLVRAIPETPVVLCHLATPIGLGGDYGGLGNTAGERDKIAGQWKDSLSRLAEVPHVRFKISGLLMPIVGFGAEQQPTTMSKDEFVDRVGPLVTWALDTFGIRRCMFGSNFPMDKVSISYQTLVAALDELLQTRTEEAKQLFFNGVARDFYRID